MRNAFHAMNAMAMAQTYGCYQLRDRLLSRVHCRVPGPNVSQGALSTTAALSATARHGACLCLCSALYQRQPCPLCSLSRAGLLQFAKLSCARCSCLCVTGVYFNAFLDRLLNVDEQNYRCASGTLRRCRMKLSH
jgi:hypothetical protein